MHPFQAHVNPPLGERLAQLSVDKRFVRGHGCHLYDEQGARYLDFIAAYGALPFGFNPPEIWDALRAVEASGEPSFAQPSLLDAAGELAARLVGVAPAGLSRVTFANSGAEAIEVAIKIARARTGRRGVLSTTNAFHGKTLAALSATGRGAYQTAFGVPLEGFTHVPFGDLSALERALRDERPAVFLVEPIQGEGGIVVPPRGYLAEAARLCRDHDVLFALDEVQTGLGRTGSLFACEDEGVTPDILVLAKALGGGLVPIAAVLATADAYTETFALSHSSTFAGNTLACRVGIRVLDLLTPELLARVAANGAFLQAGLLALRARFPEIVRDVRGRGFMLGLELSSSRDARSGLLGVMAAQQTLATVVASYLLNVERVRVAPTLHGGAVLRIEPPLVATRAMCEEALAAIERTVERLAAGDTASFAAPLLGVPSPAPSTAPPARPSASPSGDPREGRFAFVLHPLDVHGYLELDPTLVLLPERELRSLATRCGSWLDPFVLGTTRIESKTGASAYGEFIALPRTAEELVAMDAAEAVKLVRKGIELAKDRGARVVGLGAYTSVVTAAGLRVRDAGVPLTTGNAYTVVAAVDAVQHAMGLVGVAVPRSAVAVVGAGGAIGRATALLLGEHVARLLLVGNPSGTEASRTRLKRVAIELVTHLQGLPVWRREYGPLARLVAELCAAGWEPEAIVHRLEKLGHLCVGVDASTMLPQADVVVSATSSVGEILKPSMLKHGAVVCDLSRPANVSRAVRDARPDVLVIDGGVVAVPGRANLGCDFGFEAGFAYACMAETMILGLDGCTQHTSLGADLPLDGILRLRERGRAHGFSVTDLRSFDRPLGAAELARVMEARGCRERGSDVRVVSLTESARMRAARAIA